MIELLLARGAEMNAVNRNGESALFCLARVDAMASHAAAAALLCGTVPLAERRRSERILRDAGGLMLRRSEIVADPLE